MTSKRVNIDQELIRLYGKDSFEVRISSEIFDINTQLEFFDLCYTLSEPIDWSYLCYRSEDISNSTMLNGEKKELLVMLAKSGRIDAYRMLEKMSFDGDNELECYHKLALNSLSMQLEHDFLEQGRVFISTGLGGEGNYLRYFAVISTRTCSEFSEVQQRILKNEIEIEIEKIGGRIEKVDFNSAHALVTFLIGFERDAEQLLKNVVRETNILGCFLSEKFLLTNEKILDLQQIKKLTNC